MTEVAFAKLNARQMPRSLFSVTHNVTNSVEAVMYDGLFMTRIEITTGGARIATWSCLLKRLT